MAISERIYYTFLHPLRRFVWFITYPRSIRVKCVIEYNDELLFVRNKYLRYWTLPGGYVRRKRDESTLDESPQQSVERLLRTNLGINPQDVEPLCEFHTYFWHRRDLVECFYIQVKSRTVYIQRRDLWQAAWFKKDEIPSPLGYTARALLQLYFAKRK